MHNLYKVLDLSDFLTAQINHTHSMMHLREYRSLQHCFLHFCVSTDFILSASQHLRIADIELYSLNNSILPQCVHHFPNTRSPIKTGQAKNYIIMVSNGFYFGASLFIVGEEGHFLTQVNVYSHKIKNLLFQALLFVVSFKLLL